MLLVYQSLYVFVTPVDGFEGDEKTIQKELKLLVRNEVNTRAHIHMHTISL